MINKTAAAHAAVEAVKHMATKASVSPAIIMAEIVANPAGETAKYFQLHLKAGHDALVNAVA